METNANPNPVAQPSGRCAASVPVVFVAVEAGARPDLADAFRRAWDGIGAPGASLSGDRRVAVAAVTRAGTSGEEPPEVPLSDEMVAFVELLAADPAEVRATDVTTVGTQDGFPHLIEAIGICSRVAAIDTFHVGMGLPLEPLPSPRPGEPTGAFVTETVTDAGWVPKARIGSIIDALSLVPAEKAAMEDLHGPLYMTGEEMGDPLFTRGLTRPQIELVASRTSHLNDCFY